MTSFSCYSGLCVSSASGGGGKTLLSLGLGRALAKKNLLVKAFKKGPDYIDSAWLAKACKNPAANLDPFFLADEDLRLLFLKNLACQNAEDKSGLFALLEGNRGLYDGMDANGSRSTARLSRNLNLPVLLCLNCEKATRTMAAVIHGLTSFEKDLKFCGVVLNRAGSPRHARTLRQCVEGHTDLKIIGILPRLPNNPLPERHMGLASRGEDLAESADKILNELGDFISSSCDVDGLLASLPSFPLSSPDLSFPGQAAINLTGMERRQIKPRIGYVKDSAFWFYYPENLSALEEAGAELVRLKIISASKQDLALWENLDGLYLGGGFPEDFAQELEASPLLAKIAEYAENDLPIYAECGGLAPLCRSLIIDGKRFEMAGFFQNDIVLHKKPRGLGYVEGVVISENSFFPKGQIIRGHEFHYSDVTALDESQPFAMKLNYGRGLAAMPGSPPRDALIRRKVWAGYTHIFAPALPCWAMNFTSAAKRHKAEKK